MIKTVNGLKLLPSEITKCSELITVLLYKFVSVLYSLVGCRLFPSINAVKSGMWREGIVTHYPISLNM